MWIGTRWCNYHTSAGLILVCTSLQPLPQGVEWGSFFRNQAKRNSGQWAPRIWSERARATLLLSGITSLRWSKGWEVGTGKGGAKGKELTEQFPRLVLASEMHLCPRALIMTVKSQGRLASHPSSPLVFVRVFPLSVSSLHPGLFLLRQTKLIPKWKEVGRKTFPNPLLS